MIDWQDRELIWWGGVVGLAALGLAKAKFAGMRRPRWQAVLAGHLAFAASVFLPWHVTASDQVWTICGCPFLIVVFDEPGRAFTGWISVAGLFANYFLWTWLAEFLVLPWNRRAADPHV